MEGFLVLHGGATLPGKHGSYLALACRDVQPADTSPETGQPGSQSTSPDGNFVKGRPVAAQEYFHPLSRRLSSTDTPDRQVRSRKPRIDLVSRCRMYIALGQMGLKELVEGGERYCVPYRMYCTYLWLLFQCRVIILFKPQLAPKIPRPPIRLFLSFRNLES